MLTHKLSKSLCRQIILQDFNLSFENDGQNTILILLEEQLNKLE